MTPPDRDLLLACEGRLVNAWPAFETEYAEGWLLRFAEGYSKRANAATPIAPGARLDGPLIAAMLASFEARGIAPCFRLTGLEDPGAEAALAEAGLADYDPSLGMVAAVDPSAASDHDLHVSGAAKPAWIAAAAAAYGGDKSNADILGRIVRRIRQPAAFGTLVMDGHDVAWGLAVAERGMVGLFDIVVSPDWRGLGIGRRLVSGLLAWGAGQGATQAYLQMRESNAVADSLYRSLGFAPAYRYTHRIRPGEIPTAAEKPAKPARA